MLSESNLIEMFRNRVQKYGDRVALRVKKEGCYQDISWREFGDRVDRVAAGLHTLGLVPGDRVAILSENRPEWAYADLGALSIGCITVPIYATNPPAQISYILQDSESKVLFVSTQDQLQKIVPIRVQLSSLKTIVVMDPVQSVLTGILSLSELMEMGGKDVKYQDLTPSVEDLATLIYTSGTTGEPKGVMLTHRNFLSNCQGCAQVIPINDQDVYLSFLPLSHVFERMAGYYLMIHQGATIAYAENLETVPQNMLEVQPTVMCGMPRFFEKLYARVMESVQSTHGLKRKIAEWALRVGQRSMVKGQRKVDLFLADFLVFRKLKSKLGGRLRFFVSGSAPLAKEIAEFFYGVGILILEGYGLTETSPVISCNRLDRFRFGTVGLPVPGVEVKIAPDEEILTRGPHVMKGYYKMETATKEVLTDDGWFHTGDMGEIDSDGFLKITDRKKDIIITSGGKNVAPQKIENLLKQSPYILDAMLYGDRKKYLTCLIVPNISKIEGHAEGRDEINQLIRRQIDLQSKELAPYEQIKYFVLLDHPLTQEAGELTPTLKIRRKTVTEKYRDLLEKLYEMQ